MNNNNSVGGSKTDVTVETSDNIEKLLPDEPVATESIVTFGPEAEISDKKSKKNRRSRKEISEEVKRAGQMVKDGNTALEIMASLGLSQTQYAGIAIKLWELGVIPPEPDHFAVYGKSLPEKLRDWLDVEPEDLIRIEKPDPEGKTTLSRIQTSGYTL